MSSQPSPPASNSAPYVRAPRPIGKRLLHLTRTLHTYVTMLGLVLLIFFSFTGFVLNNGSLYDNSGHIFDLVKRTSTNRSTDIPVTLLSGNEHLFAIEQYLRKNEHARGSLEVNDSDPLMIKFRFTSPGRTVEFAILYDSGHVEIDEESNLLASLTDLHTGEHSGRVWPWFIDTTAVFLFFAAISGLILWISLPKRRTLGIIALVVGIAACLAAYIWLVP